MLTIATVRLRLPLTNQVIAAHGAYRSRLVLLLRLSDGDGVTGWGECAALEDASYFAETVAIADESLHSAIFPLLSRHYGELFEFCDTATFHEGVAGPMAKAALEMALLDLQLKRWTRSLKRHLHVKTERVMAGAVTGMVVADPYALSRSQYFAALETLSAEVNRSVEAGFRRVKIKISPGWDVEPLTWLRRDFPNISISADANCAYEGQSVDHFRKLQDQEIAMIDQPFARENLRAHALLIERNLGVPICLDESVHSVAQLEEILWRKAADIICIKPGRLGGLKAALQAKSMCVEAEVPHWIGGMHATALAGCVDRVLSAGAMVGDIAPAGWRFAGHIDVTTPESIDPSSGTVVIPDEPGVGIPVSEDRIAHYVESVRQY